MFATFTNLQKTLLEYIILLFSSHHFEGFRHIKFVIIFNSVIPSLIINTFDMIIIFRTDRIFIDDTINCYIIEYKYIYI